MHGGGGPGSEFLREFGLALIAALLGGLAARALRLPVLLGYLAAGLIVGPHTPGLTVDQATVQQVADLGVALLMFAVGVHFSLESLGAVRRTALIAGAAQIGGTILLGIPVGLLLGWGVYGGVFLGCALALSSTAVMIRILEERGELGTTHGSILLGILIMQDLSLIVMVALLPSLADLRGGAGGALAGIGLALLKAGGFVGAALLLASRGVPALLGRVARTGSPELFLLTVVCLCFTAGVLAEWAGLGLALGTFLAGLVVSGSPFAHEVFARVQPLRDVFASLFFVSVGMLLEPAFLLRHWPAVLLVVCVILLGKALLTATAVWALGWHGRTAVLVGLGLAQIGEFSFVLASVGSGRGLIPGEVSGVILSAALITLLLTPFVYGGADRLYRRLSAVPVLARRLNRTPGDGEGEASVLTPDVTGSAPHLIILGCGRVGRYVSDALRAKKVPHIAVDYDVASSERLREQGVPVVFGDASSEVVLEQTAPREARLAIVALPDAAVTQMAVRGLKRLAPDLPVVVRVHRGVDIPRLRAAGADAVIHAEFEAGVEMIRQALDRLEMPDVEVDAYIEQVRLFRYRQEEPVV
jgi:CPA2 family monovalent cation:H+ antiporter-2